MKITDGQTQYKFYILTIFGQPPPLGHVIIGHIFPKFPRLFQIKGVPADVDDNKTWIRLSSNNIYSISFGKLKINDVTNFRIYNN